MNNPFDMVLRPPAPPMETYRWAKVTGTAPIRIQLDGDTAPVDSTPSSLTAVSVGDSVWVQLHGKQLIIIGRKV